MRIAYLLDTYPLLSETFIEREIVALRGRGFDIEVFALHAGSGAHAVEASGNAMAQRALRVLERAGRGRVGTFQAMGERWWKSLGVQPGFDWIHAGFASHPADIAWGAARMSNLPWSFSGHARDIFVDASALAEKIAAARFAGVCTRAAQTHLQQIAPDVEHKILYAPHGLPLGDYPFRTRPLAANSPRRLLGVGRLVEKKGFLLLLRALDILRRADDAYSAAIIGDGPQRGVLQKEIRRLKLDDVVTLGGAQPAHEVRRQMQGADCLVLPSLVARDGDRDGLPNVLLEAAACGLPIVATQVGGVGDFMDAATGWLCPSGDAVALAGAIENSFAAPAETQRRCQTARMRVEDDFDIERNIARLVRAFRGEESAQEVAPPV